MRQSLHAAEGEKEGGLSVMLFTGHYTSLCFWAGGRESLLGDAMFPPGLKGMTMAFLHEENGDVD